MPDAGNSGHGNPGSSANRQEEFDLREVPPGRIQQVSGQHADAQEIRVPFGHDHWSPVGRSSRRRSLLRSRTAVRVAAPGPARRSGPGSPRTGPDERVDHGMDLGIGARGRRGDVGEFGVCLVDRLDQRGRVDPHTDRVLKPAKPRRRLRETLRHGVSAGGDGTLTLGRTGTARLRPRLRRSRTIRRSHRPGRFRALALTESTVRCVFPCCRAGTGDRARRRSDAASRGEAAASCRHDAAHHRRAAGIPARALSRGFDAHRRARSPCECPGRPPRACIAARACSNPADGRCRHTAAVDSYEQLALVLVLTDLEFTVVGPEGARTTPRHARVTADPLRRRDPPGARLPWWSEDLPAVSRTTPARASRPRSDFRRADPSAPRPPTQKGAVGDRRHRSDGRTRRRTRAHERFRPDSTTPRDVPGDDGCGVDRRLVPGSRAEGRASGAWRALPDGPHDAVSQGSHRPPTRCRRRGGGRVNREGGRRITHGCRDGAHRVTTRALCDSSTPRYGRRVGADKLDP
ncbi:hypothetical protein FHR81_004683 [Actinoalloteichus hoggarensis]|uniref:Uncharacterized protein n=1 Tax=Actinoalloteichus hoggarensis TaxID=1470176 RepID=A0A221W4J1_9PSEU|nr:hypothetical protein AHOG_14650 [Actinoalloteichus hoggarensis]MBB5923612.1 hypothetical protein [Actinoalloteichus hoggarensis]